MKRVLITGASGFLGGTVARELHSQGWQVLATGRKNLAAEWRERGIKYSSCDLATSPEEVSRLTRQCDAVIHCAALSSPWGRRKAFFDSNVIATRHVIQACRAAGVRRLVHISSPSVSFAFARQESLTETAPWTAPPANHYIATKRNAELLIREAADEGLPAIVLRPKAMIGPGDTSVLPRVMRVAAARGIFPLFGKDDPPLDMTWIGDAVAAVKLALEAPPECHGRAYHVTSGDPAPRSVALRTLFEASGLPVRFQIWSLRKALAIGAALEFCSRSFTGGRWEPPLTKYTVGSLAFGQTLDISAARRDLGYKPAKNILEALRECGEAWRRESTCS